MQPGSVYEFSVTYLSRATKCDAVLFLSNKNRVKKHTCFPGFFNPRAKSIQNAQRVKHRCRGRIYGFLKRNGMRFYLRKLFFIDKIRLHSVSLCPLLKCLESLKLFLGIRHNDLAAFGYSDSVFTAEISHQPVSLNAVPRLQRIGRVINPGVEDSAVPAA